MKKISIKDFKGPIICRYNKFGGKVDMWCGIRCTSCRAHTDITPDRLGIYHTITKDFIPICENCEHKFI